MSKAVKTNARSGNSNAKGKDAKRKNIKKRKDATKGANKKVQAGKKSIRNRIKNVPKKDK